MRIIYADEMFILNFIIDYFMLLFTAKLCCLPLNRPRISLGAFIGAVYSVLLLVPALEFTATPLFKLLLGFLMCLAAFGNITYLWKVYLSFLAVSASFGGAVIAAGLLCGKTLDESLYISVSFKMLVFSFGVSYFVLSLLFKRTASKLSRKILNVDINLMGQEVHCNALYDTGNESYDPVTGMSIMIVDINTLKPLLPSNIQAYSDGVTFIEKLPYEFKMRAHFRLIPFSAIGVGSSLMPVFRPDQILINNRQQENLLVGISLNSIGNGCEYSAII